MIAKLYNWFHRFASVPSERGEYSSGYWSELVRRQVTEMSSLDKGRYLEIGCGEGLFLKQFAQKNPFPAALAWTIIWLGCLLHGKGLIKPA